MKIEVKNLDEDLALRVGTRSTRTGQDGPTVDVPPGDTATLELTDEDGLFGHPVGTSRPASGNAQPAAPVLHSAAEPEKELAVATDEQIKEILAGLNAGEGVERTRAGKIEMGPINDKLAEQGLAPINAAKRDEIAATLA